MTQIPDLEFDHTAEQTPAFADRCGCARCDRYRAAASATAANAMIRGAEVHAAVAANLHATPPATERQPIPRIAIDETAAAVVEAGIRSTTPAALAARADAQRAAPNVLYARPLCTCPRQTRPLGRRVGGQVICPTCELPRAIRSAAPTPAVQPTAESTAVAASLGVQASLRPGVAGNAPQLSPREIVLSEMEGVRSSGLNPTRTMVAKWSTLLRSIVTTTTANRDGAVKASEVVAGARTNASGIFLGFGGLGSLQRGQLAQVLAAAQLPAEWLPAAKSAHAQAGDVVGKLSGRGLIVRASRVPAGVKAQTADVRGWKARWSVGAGNIGAQVGDSFGRTVLTVTLSVTDELRIEGEEQLAATVRADFDSACAVDLYDATDVSGWLKHTLVGRFRAARLGGNWYVRRRYAADAERLCREMAKIWGRDWMPTSPALPMATCDELCAGLVENFGREAEGVLATYRKELAAAREKEADALLGTKRATTLLGELRTLAERAVGFGHMFGDRHLEELRMKLCAAADEIAESVDDLTQRFALIFEELRREAAQDPESEDAG